MEPESSPYIPITFLILCNITLEMETEISTETSVNTRESQ
jgi:hypothetical protein